MELEKNVKNKMDGHNNERLSFSEGERRKITLKNKKNRPHSWIRYTIRHNEILVNILEGAISGKRPQLQYLQQVARNTAADSYMAMKRMA